MSLVFVCAGLLKMAKQSFCNHAYIQNNTMLSDKVVFCSFKCRKCGHYDYSICPAWPPRVPKKMEENREEYMTRRNYGFYGKVNLHFERNKENDKKD